MRVRPRKPRTGGPEQLALEERTFDRALELLKSNPGKLEAVVSKVGEEAKAQPHLLLPITVQLLQTWHTSGLSLGRRQKGGKGAAAVAFRRQPMRDLLREHAARTDEATDEAAAHMRREIRRATVQSGLQASTSLAFSQVFVARFVEALHRPKGGGVGLHDVAIQMCRDLAADLAQDKEMGREERYRWIKRVLDLQRQVAAIVAELADAEAKVAGQERADLVGVRANPQDAGEQASVDLTIGGLRDHAQALADALEPFDAIQRGLVPDLTPPSG
ncbi:MAG: hypothetical protein E6Q97_20120 [Desulfurellales bacterium]|nr:MAG: hypothetical protein E6Q97_20120 [Desulfurellales bacterium]